MLAAIRGADVASARYFECNECNGYDCNADGCRWLTVMSAQVNLDFCAWMGHCVFQMVCAGGSATVAPDCDRRSAASRLGRTLADGFNGVNGTCNDCTSDCTLAVFRYRRRGLFMVSIGCDTQYDRLLLIFVP